MPHIIVNAGEHERRQCPVFVKTPRPVEGAVRVLDTSTGASLPAQTTSDGHLAFIADSLSAGETRAYETQPYPSPELVQLEDDGESMRVSVGAEPFTTYKYSAEQKRPYFYPVLGPGGKELTEEDPSDHIHHRSFYVAYGEVNGADCWGEGKHSGSVKVASAKGTGGAVFAQINAESVWQDKDGNALMTDEIVWRIYNLPSTRRIIEAKIVFKASEGDVVFGDTKEAGILCVRVAPSLKVKNTGRIVNSFGGVNEAETWGKRANWCDYSGLADGVRAGIATLDHISNPRYPCHWHVRNYGLMGTNIFGRGSFQRGGQLIDGDGSFTLKAGETMTFRYQAAAHAGGHLEADIEGAFHNFVHPPKAEWRE